MTDFGADRIYSMLDEANKRALDKLGKVNILIAGLAGVGKSTLINAVFGKDLAKTGVGLSQTQWIQAHESPNSPLRIYDTPGFEISRSQETVGAVKALVEQLRASTDPNEQIHIAWICILEQSHRIEPVHTSMLDMLRRLQIPSVVVVTQALGEPEMESKVRELAVPNDSVLTVLAEPKSLAGHIFPQRGVLELVDITIRFLPQAQKAAFKAVQVANWNLKKEAAIEAINSHTILSGGSALIPVPGGHSVALIGIQIKLIAEINAALGLSLSEAKAKDLAKTLSGILILKVGGQAAFGMALSEALKFFPGLGWFGAAAIGGPIGAAATKALGHVYLDSVSGYAQRQEPLPEPEVLKQQMERVYDAHKSYYENIASEAADDHVK